MNDPLREWIPAYHDGELTGPLREQVEAHLLTCPGCQAELAELRQLSSLLQTEPLALGSKPEDFAQQVLDHLPGQAADRWTRVWQFGLRFIPAGLLVAWAFWQAVRLVSGAALWAATLIPGGSQVLSTLLPFAGGGSSGGWLEMDLLGAMFGSTGIDTGLVGDTLTYLTLSALGLIVFSVFFLGWAATWLVHTRSQKKDLGSL